MNISEINLYASEFVSYLRDEKIDLKSTCDEIGNFLKGIENSEYYDDIKNFLFASPVPLEEKISLLKNFTNNEELLKLFTILGKKSKLNELFLILEKITKIYNDANNTKNVNVYSVIKIDDEQSKKISNLIKQTFSCEAKINNILDKSIIGGFIIEIESLALDLSIRKQLNSIEKAVFNNNG